MPVGVYQHKPHSEATRMKMVKSHIGKEVPLDVRKKISIGSMGKVMSKESKEKMSKRRLGIKLPMSTRKKMSKWHISHPSRIYSNTSIEQKIAKELTKLGIDYQQNVGLCEVANVDFYLPKYNVIIQCDGCFWHGCPTHNPDWVKGKKRDVRQDKVLTANGFNIYRFWEHDINKSASKCVKEMIKGL